VRSFCVQKAAIGARSFHYLPRWFVKIRGVFQLLLFVVGPARPAVPLNPFFDLPRGKEEKVLGGFPRNPNP